MSEIQFPTDLDCEFLGEVPAIVYFDYTEAEPAVMNPIDEAHPGNAEEAQIYDVTIVLEGIKFSVMELIPSFYVTELEERAIEFIHQGAE